MSGYQVTYQETVALRRTQIGGNWFYWVAGLTAISVAAWLMGMRFSFALGLLVPLFCAARARFEMESHAPDQTYLVLTIVTTLFSVALYCLFGYFACRGHRWAFIAGMICLAIDGAITVRAQQWLNVAMHVYALYCIFKGMQAASALNAIRQSNVAAAPGYMQSIPGAWPPSPRPSDPVSVVASPQQSSGGLTSAWPPPSATPSATLEQPQASVPPQEPAAPATGADRSSEIASRPQSKLYDEQPASDTSTTEP